MRNQVILTVMFLIASTGLSIASEVYNSQGKVINESAFITVYTQEYYTKNVAEQMAKKLANGQVFQDVDTKMYKVLYGNVQINDVVVITSMSEE